jgi:hypothetical protein
MTTALPSAMRFPFAATMAVVLMGCGGGSSQAGTDSGTSPTTTSTNTDAAPSPGVDGSTASCDLPAEAQPEDVSKPDHVIGDGTAASCTSDLVVSTIAKGGIITFNCGPDPITITMNATAKIFNDKGPKIVIDGGGKVTLSGGNSRRILYQNTCDKAQVWTTSHCNDQDSPQLTVQNLTFVDGNSTGETTDGGGGGAIFVRGGRFKVIGSRFFHNQTDPTGPDVGGGAIRVLDQSKGQPVYVVDSTFGGSDALGNIASNGAALSSIGVSYTVVRSTMTFNKAIGNGANPAKSGTPGGGSGGAIYNDGNTYTLTICSSTITDNTANEGGGAIFFVSNDRTGSMLIEHSHLARNPSKGFETPGFKGIFVEAKAPPTVVDSTIE